MRTRSIVITVVSIALCLKINIYANETPLLKNTSFNFDMITEYDGLADATVYCFFQDKKNYMWIGTKRGLNSYDGYRMKTYKHNPNDSTTLSNSDIKCFYETSDGLFYIGTDKGVNIFHRESGKFERIKYTANFSIKFIKEDKDKSLWIGTNQGLLKYKKSENKWELFNREGPNNILPADYILCGDLNSEGTLFIGTYQYLCLKEKGDLNFYSIPLPFDESNKSKMVLFIIENKEDPNTIWVGTEQGLFCTNPYTKVSKTLLKNSIVTNLIYDRNQNLWIGTQDGIYIKKRGSDKFELIKRSINNLYSIQSNVIWSFLVDRDANIWIGTDNGISITNTNNEFQFIPIRDITGSIESFHVHTILSDIYNNLWLGTSNGLIRYNTPTGVSEHFNYNGQINKSLSHGKINYLHADKNSLWIATDGGLNRYDYKTKNINQYSISDSLNLYSSNWIYSIYEDREENLWLGTYEGGLFFINKEQLLELPNEIYKANRHYNRDQSQAKIASNIINSIAQGEGGSLWIGTDHTGLNHINPKNQKIDFVNSSNSKLSNNQIKTIINDKDRNVWIATDNGLNLIEAGSNIVMPVFEERFKETILFATAEKNNIWIKTSAGIKRINWIKKKIDDFSFDNHNYTSAYYCERSNKMFMGAFNGFLMFNPDSIFVKSKNQTIRITNILLANQLIEVGKSYDKNIILKNDLNIQNRISLNYTQNSFSIEFSSFLFQKRKEISYLYRLYGFDDKWQKNEGNNNRVSFINIPSGEYQFQVKIDGSEDFAMLDITIARPWYASIYAILFYCLILFLLLFQLWRILRFKQLLVFERIEQKKNKELIELKTDFFSNVSHDFKTPLSLILGRVGQLIINESDNSQKRDLFSIQKNAQKIHSLINQMLDYSNKDTNQLIVSKTSIVYLVEEVIEEFKEEFAAKNINITFDAEKIVYPFLIDQLRMRSVVSNILSNSLKFVDQDGKIIISLCIFKETDEELTIELKFADDGCGIAKEDLNKVFNRYFQSSHSKSLNREGSGIGLSIVKKTIEEHNGTISIESEIDKGTCITLFLKTLKSYMFVDKRQEIEFNKGKKNNLSMTRKPTILIVEDNVEISNFIKETLSTKFEILIAFDGKEGLDISTTQLPELIVTDLMMPKMNGLELCKKLKENIRTALIPVVVLTAKNDLETEMRALSEHADVFISKPFDINYLGERISQLINKRYKIEEKIREKDTIEPKEEILISGDEKLFNQITEFIETNLTDPKLNVSMLCEKLGFSEKFIYRKIKLLTGMSIVEFIRSIRLKKASMYLKQNKLSVAEIMYLVGFSNATYFTKCFKEQYGVSPKKYANSEQK